MHIAVGKTTRRFAGELFGHHGGVFACGEQVLFVYCRRAAFFASQERGAQLCALCAECQHGRDTGAIHDAACCDDRNFHCAHDQSCQRQRTGHAVIRITLISAAVAAGLAALRNDEINTERFEALRFGHAGGAAAGFDAERA